MILLDCHYDESNSKKTSASFRTQSPLLSHQPLPSPPSHLQPTWTPPLGLPESSCSWWVSDPEVFKHPLSWGQRRYFTCHLHLHSAPPPTPPAPVPCNQCSLLPTLADLLRTKLDVGLTPLDSNRQNYLGSHPAKA